MVKKQILLVCIEFVDPLFSGNGILTQNMVRGLLETGFDITLLCSRPQSLENMPIHPSDDDMGKHPNLHIIVTSVPDQTWKRLDRKSCWNYMAEQAPRRMKNFMGNTPKAFDYIFAIDWSAFPTIEQLRKSNIIPRKSRIAYFVFRVFTASKELCKTEEDRLFYIRNELEGVKQSIITFVLSHVDKKSMEDTIEQHSSFSKLGYTEKIEMPILMPPLRYDVWRKVKEDVPKTNLNPATNKRYILCNARLSAEKNPICFAQMMKILHEKQILQRFNLIPLQIGSICDKEYATEVYSLLPSNSVIVNKFLTSEELGEYYQQTILNIHPSLYDAFGMTIVESAAFGVPSLIHGDTIGASSLLRESENEIFVGNMSQSKLAAELVEKILLGGLDQLMAVGEKAQIKSLSWSVNKYASELKLNLESINNSI